jgi:hypothetical protein
MTTKNQKCIEMIYAKKAGDLLDEPWKIEPSPDEVSWPDLIVTTDSGKFGLEVRELYFDESSKGSKKKATEKYNIKTICNLADSYYKATYSSIKVNFLGNIGHHDQLLGSLIQAVEQLYEFEQIRLEPYDGCVIYIQRLPDQLGEYKRWNYVSDMVGGVRQMKPQAIEMAIIEKSKNLSKYSKKIPDIRLLLVSDKMFNSGKARLVSDIICDSHGFNNVYYLSYPDEIWPIGS